jgi:hypothetical protein
MPLLEAPPLVTGAVGQWSVGLDARELDHLGPFPQLAEMTAQRDRWEQRFDQLILSALNAGERRPWWRRIRETTVDNRNVTEGSAFRLPNFPPS